MPKDSGSRWGLEGEPTAMNPKPWGTHMAAVSRVSGHSHIQQQHRGGTLGATLGSEGIPGVAMESGALGEDAQSIL